MDKTPAYLKDGKRLAMSTYSVVPKFLFSLFVVTPVWLGLLLPATLVYQLGSKALGLSSKKKRG